MGEKRRVFVGFWLLWAFAGSGCGDVVNATSADAGPGGDGDSAGDGDGDGSRSGSAPGAPGQQPTFVPSFPGAGTSGADAPLMNGQLCDYVPADNELPTANQVTTCFFDKDGDPVPAATLEQVLECVEGQDVVHLRLTFNPGFVDNTYGAGSMGWSAKRGHRFRDLTGSDHAELLVQDGDGEVALQFKLDYITEDPSAPSGYASLGVSGGDGKVIAGEASWVLDYSTSLDENLNDRGYGDYVVDSPTTDEDYTPNPDTPDWDYRMVYEVWIDVAALGGNGFGGAFIEYVHASPSKSSNDTIEVTPGECPPDFCTDPDGCYDGPPPGEECGLKPDEPCNEGQPPPTQNDCGDQPDEFCNEGAPPDGQDPSFCEQNPSDPACDPI